MLQETKYFVSGRCSRFDHRIRAYETIPYARHVATGGERKSLHFESEKTHGISFVNVCLYVIGQIEGFHQRELRGGLDPVVEAPPSTIAAEEKLAAVFDQKSGCLFKVF